MTELMIIWIILTVVFVAIEAATPQLTTIWFAAGALTALIANICNAAIWLQIVIFVIVTAVCLVLTRPLAKKISIKTVQPTNADRCIGETAVVTEDIDNLLGKGAVNIKGAIWTARSTDGSNIKSGTTVTVKEIQGVKLMVSAEAEKAE